MIRAVTIALLLAACAPQARLQALPAAVAGSYDLQNPFAKIIRGELPAAKVYEDEYVLAFMDHAPLTPGHVLVISKTSRARNLLEMSPRDLTRIMNVARRVARAQLVALAPDGIDGNRVEQNIGGAQSVFHLHVHVVPHRRGQWATVQKPTPLAERQAMAARLAAAMD
ncbi:HIT family protein [Glacieibacterium frigidum]|uniref:HIT domain-containing protein n=1 Tax=Glacieibacterium frigidum TaxID=2593303 RepID=A0A552UAL9_9SPHN|nr:HIT domain-containing protein [Glacieibacterium frigidum]TRW15239.1 HIT domain-containing protein [Glacieibacterium frigidum]